MAEEKKEKKENWFSKQFHKISTSIDNSTRESALEKEWCKEAKTIDVNLYTSAKAFSSSTIEGKLDIKGKTFAVYGEKKEEDIPYSSVIQTIPEDADKELPKRFYLTDRTIAEEEIEIEEEDPSDKEKKIKNSYKRKITTFKLDPNVQEVKVIKVKDDYVLALKK